jgi:hypothetical protein
MTTRTPAAPAGFALPAYERPVGVNPPLGPLGAPGQPVEPGALRFDIHLQGDHETVFLDA